MEINRILIQKNMHSTLKIYKKVYFHQHQFTWLTTKNTRKKITIIPMRILFLFLKMMRNPNLIPIIQIPSVLTAINTQKWISSEAELKIFPYCHISDFIFLINYNLVLILILMKKGLLRYYTVFGIRSIKESLQVL